MFNNGGGRTIAVLPSATTRVDNRRRTNMFLLFLVATCLIIIGTVSGQQPIKSRIVSTLLNKKDLQRSTELIETGSVSAVTLRKGRNGEGDMLLYIDSFDLKAFDMVNKNVTTLYTQVNHNCYQIALNPLNNDELIFNAVFQIFKLNIKTRNVVKLAGTGIGGYNGDNILAVNAQINQVFAITYNSNNELVFSDSNRIRKILLNGTIVTIAGTSTSCDGATDSLNNVPPTSVSLCQAIYLQHVKFTSHPEEWLYFRDLRGVKRINPLTGMLELVFAFGIATPGFYLNPLLQSSNRNNLIPNDMWLGSGNTVVAVSKNSELTEVIVGGGTDQNSLIVDARTAALGAVYSFAFDHEKNEMYIGLLGRIVKYVRSDRTIRHVLGCAANSCPMKGLNMDAQLSSISVSNPSIFIDDQNQMYYSDVSIIKIMDLNSRFIKNYISHNSLSSIHQITRKNGLVYVYNGVFTGTQLSHYNETSKVLQKVAGGSWYTEGGLAISNSIINLNSFAFNSNNEILLAFSNEIRVIRNDGRMYRLISGSSISDNSSFTETRLNHPFLLTNHPTMENEMYFTEPFENVIRKIDFTTSRVLRVAGRSTGTALDGALAIDSSIKVNCYTFDEIGNLYFTDGNRLRIINQTDSRVYSLTSSNSRFSQDGTELSSLSLMASSCVVGAKNGVIYIVEDKSIRKIHPTCNTGFILNAIGSACVACGSGLTNNEYFTECVPSCFGKTDLNACSQNGKCVSNNLCECNSGWTGSECTQTTCFGISNTNTLNVCSGRGSCIQRDTCKCSDGFRGKSCELSYWKDEELSIGTDMNEYVINSNQPILNVKFNTTYQRPITVKMERYALGFSVLPRVFFRNLTVAELTNVISQQFTVFTHLHSHLFVVTVFDQETGIQISNSITRDVNVISCSTCQVIAPSQLTLIYNNTRPSPGDPVSLTISFVLGFSYLFTFNVTFTFNNVTYYSESVTGIRQSVVINVPPVFESGTLVTSVSLYGQPFFKNSSYFMLSRSTNGLAFKTQELFVEDNWINLNFNVEKIQFKSNSATSNMEMRINHVDFLSLFKDKQLTANVSMYMIDQFGKRQNQIYFGNHSMLGSNAALSIAVPKEAFSIRSDWTLDGFVTLIFNGTVVSNEKKTIRPITFQCQASYIGPNCDLTICNGVYSNSSNVCSGRGTCISANCNCEQLYKGNNCEMLALKSSSLITQLDLPFRMKGSSQQLSTLTISINASDVEFLNEYKEKSIIASVNTLGTLLGDLTLSKTNNFTNSLKITDSLIAGTYTFRIRFSSNIVSILDNGFYYPSFTYVVGAPAAMSSSNPSPSTPGGNRETTLSDGISWTEMGINRWFLLISVLISFILI